MCLFSFGRDDSILEVGAEEEVKKDNGQLAEVPLQQAFHTIATLGK